MQHTTFHTTITNLCRRAFCFDHVILAIYCVLTLAIFVVPDTKSYRQILYLFSPFLVAYIYMNKHYLGHIKYSSIALASMAFMIISISSVFWSETNGSAQIFRNLKLVIIMPIILAPLYILVFKDDQYWNMVLLSLLTGVICVTLYNITSVFYAGALTEDFSSLSTIKNGTGLVFNSNDYALFVGFAILICTTLITNRYVRYGFSLYLFLYLFAIESRGALVAFMAIITLYILTHLHFRQTVTIFCVILLCIGAHIFYFGFFDNPLITRGTGARLDIWRQAIDHFFHKPLIGHGIETPIKYSGQYAGSNLTTQASHEHSIYFAALVNTGIIGFFLLSAMLFFVTKTYIAYKKNLSLLPHHILWFYMIVFVSVHGLFNLANITGNLNLHYIYLWFPMTAMVALECRFNNFQRSAPKSDRHKNADNF